MAAERLSCTWEEGGTSMRSCSAGECETLLSHLNYEPVYMRPASCDGNFREADVWCVA
jgi:hypothetical protein